MTYFIAGLLCVLAQPACDGCPGGQTLSGPKLILDYSDIQTHKNAVDDFMYFVPLVAPTTVTGFTDPNTTLTAGITTHIITERGDGFQALCEFEIKGVGAYTAVFDPDQMIAFNSKRVGKSKPLSYMLYSIRISGRCSGLIEINGSIQQDKKTVNEVLVRFDRDGTQSPVFASLYDVSCIEGRYDYRSKTNEQIARISTLRFTGNDDEKAEMGVEICSIRPAKGAENLLAGIKAVLANWFLPPMPIAVKGNNTMLDFGKALMQKQPTFVFPYAENLKQSLSTLETKKVHSAKK